MIVLAIAVISSTAVSELHSPQR